MSAADNADGNRRDVAPGITDVPPSDLWPATRAYIIGFALSIMLTAASFYVGGSQLLWQPSIPVALGVLAIAQIGIHLVFFLHITTAPDNTNNALALAFGVLIVALIIGGSIWIMDHLDRNMMPLQQLMQMQR